LDFSFGRSPEESDQTPIASGENRVLFYRQDLQDLLDFLLHFQFPDEIENTQSAFSGN
jgi:hypothetical protein